MRITVIDGHPDRGSYGEALARAYVDGAKTAGHEGSVCFGFVI